MSDTIPNQQNPTHKSESADLSVNYINQLLDQSQRLAHIGGWEWDIRKQQMYWTSETYRIHDLDPVTEKREGQELIELSLSCYLPAYRPLVKEAFTRCCEEGVSYDLEVELQTVSGRYIWARTIGDPVVENGEIVRVSGNIMDITDTKQKELAVRYSEMKFRAIMEQAAEMLFLHDMQGNIVEVNRAACVQTGYTTDELLTMSVFDIDPDAENRLDRDNIWRALSQLQEKTFEVIHKRKDGSSYPAEVTAGKISYNDEEYILALARNISTRKQLEQNLIKGEQQTNALFTAIPDMIFLLDSAGVFLSYKAAREDLFAKPEQFIGRNISEVLPADLAGKTKDKIRDTLQTSEIQIYEYNLDYPGNGIRYYECRMIPYESEEVIAIVRDITETKRMTELIGRQNRILQENEERFRRIFEDSSIGIALVSNTFHFIRANTVFCRLIDRNPDELKKLTFRDITHPEDVSRDIVQVSKLMAGQLDVYKTEKRYLRKDQKEIWANVKVSVIRNKEGEFLYFLAMIEDITERKQLELKIREQEKLYRMLVENQGEGIGIVDKNEQFVFVNPAAEEIFDVLPGKLYGRNLMEFIPSEYVDKIHQESMNRAITGKNSYELEIVSSTGICKHILVTATPQFNDQNEHIGAFGIFRDITVRREMEMQLKNQAEILQSLNSTKDKLFSIIAHDLRNPFNSILGFSELLEARIREKDYQEIEKYAGVIHRASQRIVDLLTNLLEWSRSQTGEIKFNPTNIDLSALIQEAMKVLSLAAESKQVKIIDSNIRKEIIFADAAMIGSVIRNLISNAIKFSHPNGEILISATDTGNELVITIHDRGIGMTPDLLAGLFRIDENTIRTGTCKERGTGMGLILCKEFIEKHGGRIWAESETDKGSRFFFTLPKTPLNHNHQDIS